MTIRRTRLDGITILRFIAALYVFLFHANMRVEVNTPPLIRDILSNGPLGMSLFFVLSGFILTYTYDSGVCEGYFRKRIKRIYPAYVFCGLLTLPVLLHDTSLDLHSVTKALVTLTLYFTSTQAWFYPSFSEWQFGGTWSISTEMFFYAVFPLLLKVANSTSLHRMAIISFIATATIIPVSLIYSDSLLFTVYYATPIYRLPEFTMGIVAAKYMKSGLVVSHFHAVCFVVLLALISAISNIGFMQYNFLLIPAICFMLIYFAQIKTPKILNPIVHLGEISYSFYLMQVAGFMILDHVHPDFIYKSGIYGWLLLFVIFTVMAQISYSLFEKRNFFETIKRMVFNKMVRA